MAILDHGRVERERERESKSEKEREREVESAKLLRGGEKLAAVV